MKLDHWLAQSRAPEAPNDMALSLDLEHKEHQQRSSAMLRSTSLGLVAVGVWAAIAPMRELAIAPGQITPEAGLRAIQHLEGGVVSDLPVEAGAIVRANDPLLVLAPIQAESDLGQLMVRISTLTAQKQQIDALLQVAAQALDPALIKRLSTALTSHDLFEPRLSKLISDRRSLQARIGQKRAEIEGLNFEIRALKDYVDSQSEQLSMRQSLLAQGYTSRKAYLEASAALSQSQSQKFAADGRLAIARQALEEAESQLNTSLDEARRLWSEELSKITADLDEAKAMRAKLEDRQERLVVKAPVDGVVQVILPRSRGEVIKPGDVVARLVPTGSLMIAEVQVKPEDIGHIKIGDRADVKVSTFDPALFGVMRGEVASISPATFQKENGEPYFRATIALKDQALVSGHRMTPVTPGMVVSAEIVTGERTLLHYLLRPMIKTLDLAFHER